MALKPVRKSIFSAYTEDSLSMAQQETQSINVEELEKNMPTTVQRAFEFILKFRKQFVTGLAAIVALGLAVGGFQWYDAHAMNQTRDQLGAINLEAAGQEKIAKLEELLKQAPSVAESAVLLELASASMESRDYAKAAEYWTRLAADADTDTAVMAELGKAKCLLLEGRNAEALAVLRPLSQSAPESFTVPVNRQLAEAAEAAGESAAALEAYEKLLGQPMPDKQYIEYKVSQLKGK